MNYILLFISVATELMRDIKQLYTHLFEVQWPTCEFWDVFHRRIYIHIILTDAIFFNFNLQEKEAFSEITI